jgi:capsular exopolysaccharide synthesis family protein
MKDAKMPETEGIPVLALKMRETGNGEFSVLALVEQVRRFLHFLVRKWWIPVLTVALALVGQLVYIHFYPPSAVATSRMLVGGKVKIPEGGLYAEEWQNFFGTQGELMGSEKIQRRTLERLQRLRQTKDASQVTLTVNPVRKTTIFALKAIGKDPVYTANYLNALMDEYLSYRKEVRVLSSDDTLASLTTQFLEQEKELKRHQEGMLEFQKTNSVAALQEQASSANLTKLNQELADLKLQRAMLEGISETAQTKEGEKENGKPLEAAANLFGVSMDLKPKQALEMLKYQREELARTMRPEHPKMQRLDQEIARAEKLVAFDLSTDRDQLTTRKESIDLKIKSIDEAIKQWEEMMISANRRLAEYTILKDNLDRVQNLYDHLVHLLQNVGLDKNVDQETVVILDQAFPYPPRLAPLQRILAGVIGLIVGLGLVGFVSACDDRLISVSELKLRFPEKLVGQIPDVSNGKDNGLLLIEPNDHRHVWAESYRKVRAELLHMASVNRPRIGLINGSWKAEANENIILVTSAMPGEGKSTVTANLARSLAFAGAKVVLVDGDLRTGRLHESLGLPCAPGLHQVHRQTVTYRNLAIPTAVPNLSFIPRGGGSLDSGDFFVSSKVDKLLEELSGAFDYVLIDSAPIFAASDTLSLAPKAGGTIFVLRDSFTRAGLAREALNQLYQMEARVLGIVFNRTNGSAAGYNYFENSEYQIAAPVASAQA